MRTKRLIKRYSIWILIIFFGVLYSVWSVNRHNHFGTDAVDLGIFDQPIWHWSRFEAPLSTIKYNQYPGAHILGDHFHPVLVALAPLYWLWDDVRVLLIVQALFVAVAAWPTFKTAKKVLASEVFALALSFSFLTFIGIQAAVDWDFHETTLSVLPLAFSFYFLISKNYRGYWLSFFLGLLFKEDMPLYYSMIGLFAFLRFGKARLGLTTMIISLAYYLLVTQKLIPYFKHDRFAYEELDPALGKTTFDLLRVGLTRPWIVLRVLATPILKLKTVINYFASFSLLPVFEPLSLLLVLPNIVARFLTQLPQRWLIRYQYGAVLAPLLAVGTIFGVENVLKGVRWVKGKMGIRGVSEKAVLYLVSGLLILFPLVQTYRTKTFLLRVLSPSEYETDERYKKNYRLLAMIPKDPKVSVMAQSAFVPHLTHRAEIYRYEDTLLSQVEPDYILMSADEHSDPPFTREQLEERVKKLRVRSGYEVLYWDGARLLLKLKVKN